jgi:hypothetical protein
VSQLVAAHEGPVSPRDPGTGPDASAEEPA